MKHIKKLSESGSEQDLFGDLINLGFGEKGYYVIYIASTVDGSTMRAVSIIPGTMYKSRGFHSAWDEVVIKFMKEVGIIWYDDENYSEDHLQDGKVSYSDWEELFRKCDSDVYDDNRGVVSGAVYELTPKTISKETISKSYPLINPYGCAEMGKKYFSDFQKINSESNAILFYNV